MSLCPFLSRLVLQINVFRRLRRVLGRLQTVMASGRCRLDHGDWDGRLVEEVQVCWQLFLVDVGRVRLAKNVNTGQLAAVKIVPKSLTPTARKKDDGKSKAPEKTGDNGLSYSIEREVVIMKLIEHPNVMSLYDVWENRGELCKPRLAPLISDTSY
jgi:hypothetical protein